MDDADKPTVIEKLCGLLMMSGVLMVICAIPIGLVFATLFKPDVYWMAIAFVVIAIAISLTGGMLCVLGQIWVKQHWKSRGIV
jgi:hypothetical protein